MNILRKYLDKLGVEDYSSLSPEEKETYSEWEEVLSGKKLTDEDVAIFLESELSDTLDKLQPGISAREDCFLKMKVDMIRKIKVFLNSPETQRKVIEQNISNLIKQ